MFYSHLGAEKVLLLLLRFVDSGFSPLGDVRPSPLGTATICPIVPAPDDR
jgi:hypothetical protein